jgi:hypothetical protein
VFFMLLRTKKRGASPDEIVVRPVMSTDTKVVVAPEIDGISGKIENQATVVKMIPVAVKM